VIMGFEGGADFGGHCIRTFHFSSSNGKFAVQLKPWLAVAPAYNVTREQVDAMCGIFVDSVEELLREHS
jgi:hypothetical protein